MLQACIYGSPTGLKCVTCRGVKTVQKIGDWIEKHRELASPCYDASNHL